MNKRQSFTNSLIINVYPWIAAAVFIVTAIAAYKEQSLLYVYLAAIQALFVGSQALKK